jgi:hypothetical protein
LTALRRRLKVMTMTKKTLAIVTLALAAGLVAGTAARAAPNEKVDPAARKSVDAWLALVDQEKYGESWEAAAKLFRKAVSRDRWKEAVSPVRAPLGKVLSRKLRGAETKSSLPGAPDGKYVVFQFDTSFAGKKSAVETVTPMQEEDGSWKVSGYFIK